MIDVTHIRAPLALLGLASALGGVIALEASSGSPTSRDAAHATTAAPIHVTSATHTAPPPLGAWASVILSRPLFAPDRRPAVVSARVEAALPRLSATIHFADTAFAIFEPDTSRSGPATTAGSAGAAARPITVALGARIAGWTLSAIEDGSVELARDGRIARLQLGFSQRPIVTRRISLASVTVLHDKRTSPFLQP